MKAVEGVVKVKEMWKSSEEGGGVTEGGRVVGKMEDNLSPSEDDPNHALKLFLDRIPISSIPGIQDSPVLELKPSDSIRDAMVLLHQKNIFAAPIADKWAAESRNFSDDHNIGLVDLSSMILWCLEVQCRSDRSFLVEGEKVVGVVILRNIVMQFSLPADANIGRGGFFQSALHEIGCHDNKGNSVVNS